MQVRRWNARSVGYLFAGLLVALAGWGFWWEPASLSTREYDLVLPGWPAAAGDLRIAVLADLHTGSPHNDLEKLQEVVDATNRAHPDLVLLAGDFVAHGVVGGQVVEPEASARVLRALHAPVGVYAVLGNHDWWFDGPRVRHALEGEGIPVLEDRAIPLVFNRMPFWLAGVSDFWEAAHDVRRALTGVDETHPVIIVTHNPDVFPDIPARVTLTIAGHTHGGQVAVPGLGRPVVPSQFGERYAIGHIVEGGRHLFVSTGIGTSILPVRFRVPPEISMITLRSGVPHRQPSL
ncbi:MAG: phosphohydrolase [Nitrospira sp. SCN 59-13]|nr:MAG: phosphohydrolase [Nitrospira sp. SCN 59-13]